MTKHFYVFVFGVLLGAFGLNTAWGQACGGEGNGGSCGGSCCADGCCAISYRLIGVDHIGKWNANDLTWGAELGYQRPLTKGLCLMVPVRLAQVNIPAKDEFMGATGRLMLSADARVAAHLWSCRTISPYLFAGVGFNNYFRVKPNAFDVQIPVGAGLDFNVMKGMKIALTSEYRVSALAKRNNWVHGLGLVIGLNGCKKSCEAAANMPEIAPAAEPDMDGDGVADVTDQCPLTPGPTSNNGCPVISEEVKSIFDKAMYIEFEYGKSDIKAESYAILNEVVRVMNENPTFHLALGGHTDSKGSDEFNMELSVKRAKAAYDYLLSKGISASRLESAGYGETSPIDTNDTEEGRARNRRVEFKVK